jgi:threonine aldolase
MRQAGVLAAAGLIALEKMPLRLHEDHANARMIAEAMAQIPEVEIDLDGVQTNIVIFSLRTGTAANLVASAKARDIRISSVGPRAVRLVTHHDADRAACEKAVAILSEEVARAAAIPASVA